MLLYYQYKKDHYWVQTVRLLSMNVILMMQLCCVKMIHL